MEIQVDKANFQKMTFIFNAVNSGWTVKKKGDAYVFTKEHDGKKEVFSDTYLQNFIRDNFDMTQLLT
jgi:hypothetical protein